MKDTKDIIESSYFKKVLELIKSVLPVIIYPNEPESLAVKITKLHLESQIKEKPIRTAEEIKEIEIHLRRILSEWYRRDDYSTEHAIDDIFNQFKQVETKEEPKDK